MTNPVTAAVAWTSSAHCAFPDPARASPLSSCPCALQVCPCPLVRSHTCWPWRELPHPAYQPSWNQAPIIASHHIASHHLDASALLGVTGAHGWSDRHAGHHALRINRLKSSSTTPWQHITAAQARHRQPKQVVGSPGQLPAAQACLVAVELVGGLQPR